MIMNFLMEKYPSTLLELMEKYYENQDGKERSYYIVLHGEKI